MLSCLRGGGPRQTLGPLLALSRSPWRGGRGGRGGEGAGSVPGRPTRDGQAGECRQPPAPHGPVSVLQPQCPCHSSGVRLQLPCPSRSPRVHPAAPTFVPQPPRPSRSPCVRPAAPASLALRGAIHAPAWGRRGGVGGWGAQPGWGPPSSLLFYWLKVRTTKKAAFFCPVTIFNRKSTNLSFWVFFFTIWLFFF